MAVHAGVGPSDHAEAGYGSIRRRVASELAARGVFVVLFVLCATFATASPHFRTALNLSNVATQVSLLLVASVGATLVLVGGGIDLSIGAVAVLSNVVLALVLRLVHMRGAYAAILSGILTGTLCGSMTGFIITRWLPNAFIVTLGMATIVRALAELLSGGTVRGLPPEFARVFGGGQIGFVPILPLAAAVAVVLGHTLLSSTTFGAAVRGVGSSAQAARYCGVPVRRVSHLTYVLSGSLAGLVGVMLAARTGSAHPGALVGFEFQALIAAVIGGVGFGGGAGAVAGAAAGAVLVGIIGNALNLMAIPPYYWQVCYGLIIFTAVLLDLSQRSRSD